jgi:pimeloyl-ACP methyl ester carboxylesterase
MKRRTAIQGAGAAIVLLGAQTSASTQIGAKPIIIMVHGSWHWGGCFQKIANRLAAKGYAAATPDLASHGYDDQAYDSFSTMAEYVTPVEAMIRAADAPVVLLGHSMGGVTLTYLGEKYPEKIAKLIYLTAFMAPKGKTALDYILQGAKNPAVAELNKVLSLVNNGQGNKLDLNNRDLVKAAFYADCSHHDFDIAARNVIAITSTVPNQYVSEITPGRWGKIPRVFIECTADKAISIETQRLMISDNPGTAVASIDSSHSPFFSQPDKLTDIILSNL